MYYCQRNPVYYCQRRGLCAAEVAASDGTCTSAWERGKVFLCKSTIYKHKEKHITSINTHTHKIAKNKIIKGKPDVLRCVCVFGGGGGVTPLLVPDRKQMCPLSGKNPLTSSYLYERPVFETLLSYLSPLTFVAWRQLERW